MNKSHHQEHSKYPAQYFQQWCKNFHLNDIKLSQADIREYKSTIHNFNLYHCTTEQLTLGCKENFLGVKSKSINILK